jgi:hypothetical protein
MKALFTAKNGYRIKNGLIEGDSLLRSHYNDFGGLGVARVKRF